MLTAGGVLTVVYSIVAFLLGLWFKSRLKSDYDKELKEFAKIQNIEQAKVLDPFRIELNRLATFRGQRAEKLYTKALDRIEALSFNLHQVHKFAYRYVRSTEEARKNGRHLTDFQEALENWHNAFIAAKLYLPNSISNDIDTVIADVRRLLWDWDGVEDYEDRKRVITKLETELPKWVEKVDGVLQRLLDVDSIYTNETYG